MRRLVLLVVIAATSFAQTIPVRVPADEAAKHLLKGPPPDYPPLASMARIQGNVILAIRVDESGAVSSSRLVRGHPMLAGAAVRAVLGWKYRPFEVDGKAVPVMTLVLVGVGQDARPTAEESAELTFQYQFWSDQDQAEAALTQKDFAHAEEELTKEKALIAPNEGSPRHVEERGQWMMTMGDLLAAQQKFQEAEQQYTAAAELYGKLDPNAPQVAVPLASLGTLFASEKDYAHAHEAFARSVAIYQKNFAQAGDRNPFLQQVYGRQIAYQSATLARLAARLDDPADEENQCRTVIQFQRFLTETDRQKIVSACEKKPATTPSH